MTPLDKRLADATSMGEEYAASVKRYLATIGRKGGANGTGKSKSRTKEQARAAAIARWSKTKLTYPFSGPV